MNSTATDNGAMQAKTNLILGCATGYAPNDVRPFLYSLAGTGFAGTVALFIHADQRDGMRAMAQAVAPGLTLDWVPVRSIRERAKFWRSCIKRASVLTPVDSSPGLKRRFLQFQGKPHVARYFHYDRYLRQHRGFEGVLLTDVRDVVFQREPFLALERGLSVSMESADLTIATEPFDRAWILDAYGEDMLRRIGERQVSCSGVTLGDAASVQGYLDLMLGEILSQPFKKMRSKIYDQAFHNKLLHCDELVHVHRCQPLQSRIATLACLPADDLALSPEGWLKNADGSVAPIVHQYDRHPALVAAFHQRMLAR